jgi:hypothetical protein
VTEVELLALFRSDMRDEEDPPLWTDEEICTYMDDAQNMFCRLTDGISDATTPSVVRLSIVANQKFVALHKSILKIRTAALESTGAPVPILNVEDMPSHGIRFDGVPGPLGALIEGMEENKIFFHPLPNFSDVVVLTVFRRPLRSIVKATNAPLEIGEQHHSHLLHWMKHRAYQKQDAETIDKGKSKEFADTFNAYCEQVKLEQQRKRHKVRVVQYGGIPIHGHRNDDYGRARKW